MDVPGPGGFAAYGGPLTVILEEGVPVLGKAAWRLNWSNRDQVFNGMYLVFGSTTTNDVVELTSDIDLNGDRVAYTFDDPSPRTTGLSSPGCSAAVGIASRNGAPARCG